MTNKEIALELLKMVAPRIMPEKTFENPTSAADLMHDFYLEMIRTLDSVDYALAQDKAGKRPASHD